MRDSHEPLLTEDARTLDELRSILLWYPQDSTCGECLSTWEGGPYHRDDCLFVRFEAQAKAEAVEPLMGMFDDIAKLVNEKRYREANVVAMRGRRLVAEARHALSTSEGAGRG